MAKQVTLSQEQVKDARKDVKKAQKQNQAEIKQLRESIKSSRSVIKNNNDKNALLEEGIVSMQLKISDLEEKQAENARLENELS